MGIWKDNGQYYETTNHALGIVGYTPEYFILKNQWSNGWGIGGYMLLYRKGEYNTNNVCHCWFMTAYFK